jgi:bifunctional DNA-binding transcriptional regulator/antitoxin component of YhaV-PrlF toxin-antitoxin module
MKATLDEKGRITLDREIQQGLGVQPGDDVLLAARGAELIVMAAKGKTAPAAEEEAEILDDVGPIRLPPRDLQAIKAKVVPGLQRRLSETAEE